MLARLFVLVGGLLVLALCAALVGPYFVDWSTYRADFEREASAILGRRVEVRGDASARILPFPSVSFTDVVVSGSHGEPVLIAESFSMDAELAPFLRGEVLIFDMRLVRPKAELSVGEDGAVDWAMRASTPVDPGNIKIENLSIVEGQLRVLDVATGRELIASEIDTNVSAQSLRGPWRVDGALRVNGRWTTLTATTGTADGSGQMGLSLSASPEVFPVKLDTDGSVVNEQGKLRYAGKFRVVGQPSVQSLLRNAEGIAGPQGSQTAHNRVSGNFRLAHSRLDIDDFHFETGPVADPYSADGVAFLDLGPNPGFSIEATGQQFRVDEGDAGNAGGKTFADRLEAIEDTLALVPEPTIPGSVNIKLPAILTGETTIRDATLSARPEGRGWRILSATAQLPGRSTVEADGFLVGGGAPHFEGNLLLAVKQPTGFAAWLSKDLERAARTLPSAGFRSAVSIDREKQIFNALEVIVGSTRLTGSIERSALPDTRPVVVARLASEKVDADAVGVVAALMGEEGVRSHDLDVAVKSEEIIIGGLQVGHADLAARMTAERLDIDRLSLGDFAGASVAATGSVRDLTSEPIGDIDMTLTSADLAPLTNQIARWLPDSLLATEMARRTDYKTGLLTDARIDLMGSMTASSPDTLPNQLALSLSGKAGGSTLQGSVTGKLADANSSETLEAQIELSNDDATPLLALAGLPTLPVLSPGPGRMQAKIVRSGEKFATMAGFQGDGFELGFEGETGKGAPAVAGEQNAFVARGKLSLKADDVEPWLLAVGMPVPGMGFGTTTNLSADADLTRNLLVLSGLSGTIGESGVTGDANLDFNGVRPDLSGSLRVDALDLEPLVGALFGASALASPDGLSWPVEKFAAKSALPLTAKLDLEIGALANRVLPELDDINLTLRATESQLILTDISGKGAGGAVSGRVELSNENGNGLVSAQIEVKDADLTELLSETGLPAPALTGRSDVSISLSSAGPSVAAVISGLSGSGVMKLKGFEVAGLNPGALPQMLKESDALGQGIDDAAVAQFVPPLLQGANFQAGDASLAFNIASGVARAPATSFDRDLAALTAEGRIDLPQQIIDGSADFALKPGDEALVGAEPTVHFSVRGALSEPEVALDTSGLAQFLTQRQLEIEQARVEAMQASIMEKQRLRREAARYTALYARRAAINTAEASRRSSLVWLHAQAEIRRIQELEKNKAEEAARQTEAVVPKPTPVSRPKASPQTRQQPAVEIGEFPPAPPAPNFGDSDFDG